MDALFKTFKTLTLAGLVVSTGALALSVSANGAELRTFEISKSMAVPIDFQKVDLFYDFDVPKRQAGGLAHITFDMPVEGFPYFLLEVLPQSVEVNGKSVKFRRVTAPGSDTSVVLLDGYLKAGSGLTMKVVYPVADDQVGWRPTGVGYLTAMGDLKTGNFFETYGPTGYEDDQYTQTVEIKLVGASAPHRVFANGKVSNLGAHRWRVEFPSYYSSTSFYLHLSDSNIAVYEVDVKGSEKTIPVTLYSKNAELVREAALQIKGLFAEMEDTFGPYYHESFVAYLSGQGGMEYAGATITSIGALDHELLHSWFARGVMPSDGRSGWIDEGIASWRDYGYFQSAWPPQRKAVNLANFSPFERFTPRNCYRDGRQLMSELDGLLRKEGGLRPVIRQFFSDFKVQNVSTPLFKTFMEMETGEDLDEVFSRYVYGWDKDQGRTVDPDWDGEGLMRGFTKHPPQLTKAEIADLR